MPMNRVQSQPGLSMAEFLQRYGVSALELKRRLGVCYRTAWLVKHKFMEVMRQREEPRPLTRRIEVDDAYRGGERHGGKAGHGSEEKLRSSQR